MGGVESRTPFRPDGDRAPGAVGTLLAALHPAAAEWWGARDVTGLDRSVADLVASHGAGSDVVRAEGIGCNLRRCDRIVRQLVRRNGPVLDVDVPDVAIENPGRRDCVGRDLAGCSGTRPEIRGLDLAV